MQQEAYSIHTVKQELPSGNISSSAVFGHTLVHTSILWAKIWDFQNTTRVVDFDLAREWISISSSPWDGRHRAAEVTRERSRWLTLARRTAAMFVGLFVLIEDVWPLLNSDSALGWVELHRANVSDTYFPKAKHSSFTDDPLETWRVSGNWTSIFGSYSPITTAWRIKANHISQNTKLGHAASCKSCRGCGADDAGRERACALTGYRTAFALADGWVWITYLPLLKSEVVHINAPDGV